MGFYIDILAPDTDLNAALDSLGRNIGGLYAEAWDKNKRKYYDDKPFDLHINAFAGMWFDGNMKVFVLYDAETVKPFGFLTGVVFRPMPFKANVFQIQEWYVRDTPLRDTGVMEGELINHVVSAIKVLGCDEIWVQSYTGHAVDLGPAWKAGGNFSISRYTKAR